VKKCTLILLVLLMLPRITSAQEVKHAKAPKSDIVTISGKLSHDGMVVLRKNQDALFVRNADILRGYEGQEITLKCRLHAQDQTIDVLSVKSQGTANYVANVGDSAFRR